MKVLFVYTNINGTHEETYSFGLASLVAVALRAGHTARVCIVKTAGESAGLYDTLAGFQPRVVAFTSVSSQFRSVRELAAGVRERSPETIIVCGGVHTTIFPHALRDAPALDGIFRGESEPAFLEFLDRIEGGLPFTGTPNFVYRSGDTIVENPLNPLVADLDSLPFPDKTTYPYIETVSRDGIAPFLFSRGCPFSCSYCSNHAIARVYGLKANRPRYRSPESCIREIEETLRQFPSIRRVWIMDDIFGLDREWRTEFCRLYRERIPVSFDCLLRANVVDEEFIRILRDSGCYRVSFGVESGNEYIRNEVMNRKMSNDQILRAFELCHKYGLETNAINIIGIPGETEEMIRDTIRLNRALRPTTSGVNIFYPYRGTVLGDSCFARGLVDEEKYDDFSSERRESVLAVPEPFRERLKYYRENWDTLVYPHDVKRRVKSLLMKNPALWEGLRRMKRSVTGGRS
ncbi:MAG: B12-binding domain-containing radical SAM protein [Methanomicrobiales archaeon]|nr:B12-binding domain-containing radical SAM protein [Methanomicrobiales archaeon]